MDPSTELANLEKENADRLKALISGRAGNPVRLPPNVFDLLELQVLLCYLIHQTMGVEALVEARLEVQQKAAELISDMEKEAVQAQVRGNRSNS